MNSHLLSERSFFKLLLAKKQNIVFLNKKGLSRLGYTESDLDLEIIKRKIIGATEKVKPITLIFNSKTDELEVLKGRKQVAVEDRSVFSNMFIKHENVDYIITHELDDKEVLNQLEAHYSSPDICHVSIFNELDFEEYSNFILNNVDNFLKEELTHLSKDYFLIKTLPYVLEDTALYKLDFKEGNIVKILLYEDHHDHCQVYMDAFNSEIRNVVRYS